MIWLVVWKTPQEGERRLVIGYVSLSFSLPSSSVMTVTRVPTALPMLSAIWRRLPTVFGPAVSWEKEKYMQGRMRIEVKVNPAQVEFIGTDEIASTLENILTYEDQKTIANKQKGLCIDLWLGRLFDLSEFEFIGNVDCIVLEKVFLNL